MNDQNLPAGGGVRLAQARYNFPAQFKMIESFWKKKLNNTPSVPGVYLMRDPAGAIIYIGKAINLKRRIYSYFRNNNGRKEAAIASALHTIDYVLAVSEREALILERQLINKFKPFFNSMWKDDKSYPFIKLTSKEDFPRLILTRKKISDGSEYFGPYPHVMQIKTLLRWLTRIFKLRPCRLDIRSDKMPPERKVKSCLYLHTGKCAGPCLGKIPSEVYKSNTKAVGLFLRAKFVDLKNSWEKEMAAASRNMQYERAAELRDRLGALGQMQEKVIVRELQPEDLSFALKNTDALKELKDKLSLAKWPIVVEGFDISNISGTLAVGSMVCFRNGQPDKSCYRKFKIKTVAGPDDYAMLQEVVYRRYKRVLDEKGKLPDLVLIDGGKGQLSAALEIMGKLDIKNVPLASIAKREEEIFLPGRPGSVKLPRESPALHLLQQVRDEAHRFALSYHHKRRKSSLFPAAQGTPSIRP